MLKLHRFPYSRWLPSIRFVKANPSNVGVFAVMNENWGPQRCRRHVSWQAARTLRDVYNALQMIGTRRVQYKELMVCSHLEVLRGATILPRFLHSLVRCVGQSQSGLARHCKLWSVFFVRAVSVIREARVGQRDLS